MTDRAEQATYRMVFGALFGVVPIAIALGVASANLGPASIPIWGFVAGAAWLISKGAIGEAIAARIRGGQAAPELAEQTLAELDELRARVVELEERQEFTERLLARQDEPARLEGPRG